MTPAGIQHKLGSLIDVRREELPRILPLTAAYGLVMASLYVLKPARNALFLDQLGVARLPYVLLLVALLGGVVAALFTRLTRSFRLDRLIPGSFLVLLVCLLGFRLLLPHGWDWVCYLFYVWVNLYGLLATALLWLLANTLFNPREARRLFGLIGSAGIAGAIAGGALTSWMAVRVGTENLLIVCAGMLLACLLLLHLVRTRGSAPPAAHAGKDGPLAAISASDLLRLLGTMAALAAVVAAVIDVQFNDIVDRAFADRDAKTAFFGQFFAGLSVFALVFQLWATPRVLRAMGVVSALLFLPVSMGIGSLAVLFAPGLNAGMLLKIGDGGFRHSIHKSAVEILYLPVPADAKQRVKVLLDTTVDNVATGAGALLVLGLTALGVTYRNLGWVSLVLVGLWVLLVRRGRGAYIDAFRQALDRRAIDIGSLTTQINEAAALSSLVASLSGGSERQVIYALEMLASVRAPQLVEPARELLSHPSAEVRRRALNVLCHQGAELCVGELEQLLIDDDLPVRAEALYCLCRRDPVSPGHRIQAALRSDDVRLRSAGAACLATHVDAAEDLVDDEFLEELVHADGPDGAVGRAQAARLLGGLDRPRWRPLVRQLADDPDPEVARPAIESLGRLGDVADIPRLVDKLGDRRYRQQARRALSQYGRDAVEGLGQRLYDPHTARRIRVALARVLSDIDDQSAVDRLMRVLGEQEPWLEMLAIRSLSRLRTHTGRLDFDDRKIMAALRRDLAEYFRVLQAAHLYRPIQAARGTELLKRVLAEKQARQLERIFRLLGLLHNPRDMYHAYLGLVSGQSRLRASALEFLDNVLPQEINERLLPLLDYASADDVIALGRRQWDGGWATRREALRWMLGQPDGWLRACATYSAGETDMPAVRGAAEALTTDPDYRVREAVQRALASG